AIVRPRTVKVGFRTLDFAEAITGLTEGDHVVLSDQDKLRSEKRSDNEWSACRERQRNRDAATLHCPTLFDPPQTGIAPEPERRGFRRRHFYLHSGADAGLRPVFY